MIAFVGSDTTITLGEFAIHQPVTAITNIMIAAFCLTYSLKLKQLNSNDESLVYWRYYLNFLMGATLLGACTHALFAQHEGFGYMSFWLATQAVNCIGVYAAQKAMLTSVLNESANKNLYTKLINIQLVVFIIAVFVFKNFMVVVLNTAFGFIPIFYTHLIDSRKNPESMWIVMGVVVLFSTAITFIGKFSLHKYFNFLDISHVLIMIKLTMFFVGIKRKTLQQLSAA